MVNTEMIQSTPKFYGGNVKYNISAAAWPIRKMLEWFWGVIEDAEFISVI